MAELIVGIIAAALAIPTCAQALTHGVRRLKQKSKPQQLQLAGYTSHDVQTKHTLNTSHKISTHHTLDTSHAVRLDGQTYHSIEHNVSFDPGFGATFLVITLSMFSAVLYMAYHLGHSHGYHGGRAVVQGIDLAIHQDDQCPINSTESPITASFLALTATLERVGSFLLNVPKQLLQASFSSAYARGQHSAELMETSSWIPLTRAWIAHGWVSLLKVAFVAAVAFVSLGSVGTLVNYIFANYRFICDEGIEFHMLTLLEKSIHCAVWFIMLLIGALAATATGAAVNLW